MSKNNTDITNLTIQKNLFRRRLWVLAISLLLFFVYYVGAVSFAFADMRSAAWTHADILHRAKDLFGESGNEVIMIFTVLLAALSGIEGFSWMDRKRQIIFYESLPVSRAKKFWNIVAGSFLMFIGSYLVLMLIGMLIAAGRGAMNGDIAGMTFRYFAQNLFLFWAVYGASVLAAMLTGNVLIAILADAVFLGFEPVLDMLVFSFKTTMFSTFAGEYTRWTHIFSPLTSEIHSVSFGRSVLLNLAGGAVTLGLAYLVYRNFRKNEDAGKAVLFTPVRWAAKITVTSLGALLVGLTAYSSIGDTSAAIYSIVVMVVTAIIVGGIMEVIYTYNLRAALKRFPATLIGAGLAILVFCGFRYDIAGYDSWVPEPSGVLSAYICDTANYYTDHFLENGKNTSGFDEFCREYMHLKDIRAVNEVLKAGEHAYKEQKTNRENEDGQTDQAALRVGYRMKNGKTVIRKIDLPVNAENKKLMDKAVGTDEFRQGYFQIYHDGFVEKDLTNVEISYWNGSPMSNPYNVPGTKLYAEFKKAYLKDLQSFDYTLAVGKKLIGDVSIDNDDDKAISESRDYSITYPVYRNFDNTLKFLKENGLYQEPVTKKTEDVTLLGPFYDAGT